MLHRTTLQLRPFEELGDYILAAVFRHAVPRTAHVGTGVFQCVSDHLIRDGLTLPGLGRTSRNKIKYIIDLRGQPCKTVLSRESRVTS